VDLPRNPNGFWRGVDDVLKMQKGTIAAVSSVFTGDYAVPQDSWEAAGYAIGIPLAMGAQIITAEASLGAEAIESLYQGSQRVFGSVTGQLEKWGFFGKNGVESSRLLSSVERVSSDLVNKDFVDEDAIAAGWKPPYPDNLSLRKITIAQELKLYRVHANADWPFGQFLAREKEIAPFLSDPEALRLHLGLPNMPIYITEVNVPANTELLVGRIGPQPSFGLMDESGFQYQLLGKISESSFVNTRPILRPSSNLDMGY
jgi:hypothetical protein